MTNWLIDIELVQLLCFFFFFFHKLFDVAKLQINFTGAITVIITLGFILNVVRQNIAKQIH